MFFRSRGRVGALRTSRFELRGPAITCMTSALLASPTRDTEFTQRGETVSERTAIERGALCECLLLDTAEEKMPYSAPRGVKNVLYFRVFTLHLQLEGVSFQDSPLPSAFALAQATRRSRWRCSRRSLPRSTTPPAACLSTTRCAPSPRGGAPGCTGGVQGGEVPRVRVASASEGAFSVRQLCQATYRFPDRALRRPESKRFSTD